LLLEKPQPARNEAEWLEAHEAALLLESARTYKPQRDDRAMPFAYPLIATFLLTGGRTKEVLGLKVDDISFDRRTITFRPNEFRRLKTSTSHRTVPLWPQLEEVLREHLYGGDTPRVSGLLFPSNRILETDPKTGERRSKETMSAPDWTRTSDLRLRRPLLYPAELLALIQSIESGRPDSNWRPLAPKASALPG
jgi:integrase